MSGEPPAPYGRYQNIFLSQTEYDELQAEDPDRLERFIEEMSRYLAASGKSYQNYAAACKSQYKNAGFGQNKNVGFPTFLFCLSNHHQSLAEADLLICRKDH